MSYSNFEASTKIILKVIFALLALGFLWVVRDIVVLLLLSLVFASAMEPLAAYLYKRGIPRSVSVLTVYILVVGLAVLVVSLLIPPIISQAQHVQEQLPDIIHSLQERLPFSVGGSGVDYATTITREIVGFFDSSDLYSRTVGVVNGLFGFISVLVISFYLVAEEKGVAKFVHTLVPAGQQMFVLSLIEKFQHKMGRWLLGQLLLSLSIFVLTYVGLSIVGVQYALFLALLAGLLEVVPYIGPFLSAVPAVVFAFLQSPSLALGVVLLYVVIQKTEGYILVPKIMEKTVGTTPLVVLVALLVGFKLAGIYGLLLAVPVVSAISVVIEELGSRREG